METTKISDVIVPEVFNPYVVQRTMELKIHINFVVASMVAVWITCNEIISILENVNDMGVNIPPFLMPLVKNIKSQVEKKTEISESESDK